jgi:hypothetical protein
MTDEQIIKMQAQQLFVLRHELSEIKTAIEPVLKKYYDYVGQDSNYCKLAKLVSYAGAR